MDPAGANGATRAPLDRVAVDWIAVDWGTSHLRTWALGRDGAVLAEAQSDDGMERLAGGDFESALLALVAPWLDPAAASVPVLACGMVGSRQGWAEAPYRPVPCAALAPALTEAPVRDARLRLWIVPGVRQDSPADVMRGEETQIAGFLAAEPGFDGVLCLPGTHSKWVRISAGEIVSFQTFVTGELFAVLGRHSVLRHSLDPQGWDAAAFAAALDDAMSRPERLAARLFAIRAEHLLHGLSGGAARARLSGALIGAELAAARPYWLGQDVVVIGAAEVSGIYAAALAAQGLAPRCLDAGTATRAGLTALRQQTEAST